MAPDGLYRGDDSEQSSWGTAGDGNRGLLWSKKNIEPVARALLSGELGGVQTEQGRAGMSPRLGIRWSEQN